MLKVKTLEKLSVIISIILISIVSIITLFNKEKIVDRENNRYLRIKAYWQFIIEKLYTIIYKNFKMFARHELKNSIDYEL